MEIRQLQTFKTVAELNSFTKASQKLQYSQASVTSHIKQLEEELGYPLFDRFGKQIQMTSIGKELFPLAAELLSTYSKIKDLSEECEVKGEIRIGASETLAVYKLSAVISEFKGLYPNVTFTLMNDHCARLRDRLHTGELDIAITLEPHIVEDPLLTTHVWSEEPLIYVGSGHTSVQRIEESEGECFIFSDRDCALRKYFKGQLMQKGIQTHNQLEFTSMEAMKQCVVSGLGISLMPKISVERLLDEGKMKAIDSAEDNRFFAQVSFHKNKWMSSASNLFINTLINHNKIGETPIDGINV